MTSGAMQYGKVNNSNGDGTELASESIHETLRIFNSKEPEEGRGGTAIKGIGAIVGVDGRSFGGGFGVVGEGLGRNSWGVLGIGEVGIIGIGSGDDATSVGIYGACIGDGPAGEFNGPVRVFGELAESGGGFLIDHPLDPENRRMRHSFVESSERLNVYSGTVVTDGQGAAKVELPTYFQTLNKDVRYQLTVVGEFAHAVISEEVQGNRFAIATDRPMVKVSWQVSGVRQDKYAQTNPIIVEEEKPEGERGEYVHPEAWGKPGEAGKLAQTVAARVSRHRSQSRT